ncbi:MAG TPA: tetratricopeptide repeat protein [Terriglobales bacterium]|nr:tetratricopeptide repeat protein [Terriglobales bacterium]
MKSFLINVTNCSLLALAFVTANAQTFEIGGQQQAQPAQNSRKGAAASSNSSGGIGWGSSIEVGRMARAAETALKNGDTSGAANYAERAVKAAPQDAKLWFLLGYTSRLAGRYPTSLSAFQKGLQLQPGSVEGLSGLAQTYMRMGRTDEAKRLLLQVIAANPKRDTDLLIAGELFIQTGDTQRGLDLLQRAENMKPSSHAELLMAIAYMKLKQPEQAKALLDKAKRRSPNNVDIFRAVANYYREVHDYRNAVLTLKSAPKKTPDVLADLAYSYELNGDKKESADTYSKAADLQPQQITLQLSAAQAQLRAGDLGKARQYIARSEKLDAGHYRLHAIKAVLARAENRQQDAIAEYEKALAAIPAGGTPEGMLYPIQLRLNLADLYREAGNKEGARQQMQIAETEMSKLQVEGPAKAEFLRVRAAIRTAGEDYAGAETDLKQALQIDPENINITLQYGNLLWKLKKKDEARKLYMTVLKREPNNRFALESLGYLYREDGDVKTAAEYFMKLAKAYPDDYVAYLAMGDLYAGAGRFKEANDSYERAYKIAPQNPAVVANAANAALENHQVPLAGHWVERAKGSMNDDPRVKRETARYLFHIGKYRESATLARQVLQTLTDDRNAAVYLGYDLYNLGRYDDTLEVVSRFESILPKEANFPLLAGHVHKQSQLLTQAVADYTRAIEKDPKMVNGYVNRGYVLNDLQNANQAVKDFQTALKMEPKNGVAQLGMAFSALQLRRSKDALDHVDTAEKLLGESGATHLVRATAYRQQRLLNKAETEYRAALRYSPNDIKLHLSLADTLYYQHRYGDAIQALNTALQLQPEDPFIYAQLAHANAQLHRRAETFRYVEAAEREGGDQAGVLLATGDALLILGERDAAMERFTAALDAPDTNRVDARLAFARVMARDGKWDDAKQQVSLAFAEARIGESTPVTADNYVEAANIMLGMNDFDLARRMFERAKTAGAADEVVAIGLANTFLAQGDNADAQAVLASLGSPDDYSDNYDYKLAMANMYRQRHEDARALTAFAQADSLAGQENDVTSRAMLDLAGEQGLTINNKFSVSSDFTMAPIFEDATIYGLDAQFFGTGANGALPPPRSSLESRWTNAFRMRQPGLPAITGFFQVRNARGEVSLPSENVILSRNTYDYTLNGALNPILRIGRNSLIFNTGVQMTFRRDKESPLEINQNLFRQFVYMTTNSFWNWLSISGNAYHESGGFNERDLSSRDLGARLEFTVGRPWGKTALVTGYSVRDLQLNPLPREFFSTSSYAGISRKFGQRVKATILGEYIRSWRVQDQFYAIAQAARPAMRLEIKPAKNWEIEANGAYSRGMGIHDYDNVQSGIFISYVKPLRRMFDDGSGQFPVEYPLRFSIGFQQDTFMNFSGRGQSIFRPVIRLSLF